MSKVLKSVLLKAKVECKTVSIYLNDQEESWCGRILQINEEAILLEHYTEYGEPDGFVVEKIENIESIELDDDYLNGLDFLIQDRSQLLTESQFKLDESEEWQEILLSNFKNNFQLVRISMNDDRIFCGFILEFDKEFILLNSVDISGMNIGKTLLKTEEIQGFKFADLQCEKRLKLYNWRNQKQN